MPAVKKYSNASPALKIEEIYIYPPDPRQILTDPILIVG